MFEQDFYTSLLLVKKQSKNNGAGKPNRLYRLIKVFLIVLEIYTQRNPENASAPQEPPKFCCFKIFECNQRSKVVNSGIQYNIKQQELP